MGKGKGMRGPAGCGVETVLHTSVATFYSNLVTRPAGQAVRGAIEDQLHEAGGPSLSVLDFSQVRVIDFSCVDEVIAKLLRKYQRSDRPSDAFFVVRGLSCEHRDLVETVLHRQKLLVVAFQDDGPALWGPAPTRLRHAWDCLGQLGRAVAPDFAHARGIRVATASAWLKRLASWRLAVPVGSERFSSLPAVLDHLVGDARFVAGRAAASRLPDRRSSVLTRFRASDRFKKHESLFGGGRLPAGGARNDGDNAVVENRGTDR